MKLKLEEYLLECMDSVNESRVKEAMEYSLLGSAKRIRPLLLLAIIKDYGLDPYIGFDGAAALEMVHTYSLIHDDLPAMDNDDYRRGRLTCHKMFDEATAILAGDALLTLAFETLANAKIDNYDKVLLFKYLAQNAGAQGMILGQIIDIENENKTDVPLEILTEMYKNKTGKLLATALVMGAVIAKHYQDIEKLQNIGEKIGLAFQIQDDILDVTKTTEELGKTANSDLANHKTTYVSFLGLEKAKETMIRVYSDALEELNSLSMKSTEVHSIFELLINRQN